MDEEPRQSNRPTPRTPAAIEAELRRRVRMELSQARADADGQLDDASLAEIIARAIASALGWHVESPEHARNATLSSRTWRPAGGPRSGGGPPPPRDFDEPRRPPYPPRDYDEPRRPPYPPRGPRFDYDEPYREDDELVRRLAADQVAPAVDRQAHAVAAVRPDHARVDVVRRPVVAAASARANRAARASRATGCSVPRGRAR